MKKLLTFIGMILCLCGMHNSDAQPLNYEQMILLDAEDLAETGIKEAYDRLLPTLKKYVKRPVGIQEFIDNKIPSYIVSANKVRYEVYSPDIAEVDSWGNATYAFFDVVNRQLANTPYRFYAFYAGNDLGGMFLTEKQYKSAIISIKRKSDWPYLPTQESPWYGQPH